jgi:hypothetical protein
LPVLSMFTPGTEMPAMFPFPVFQNYFHFNFGPPWENFLLHLILPYSVVLQILYSMITNHFLICFLCLLPSTLGISFGFFDLLFLFCVMDFASFNYICWTREERKSV